MHSITGVAPTGKKIWKCDSPTLSHVLVIHPSDPYHSLRACVAVITFIPQHMQREVMINDPISIYPLEYMCHLFPKGPFSALAINFGRKIECKSGTLVQKVHPHGHVGMIWKRRCEHWKLGNKRREMLTGWILYLDSKPMHHNSTMAWS